MIEQARSLLSLGLSVIPVPYKRKGPVIEGWQHKRLREEDLKSHFKKESNVGVLLGDPSGGVVDVDLDCPESLPLADEYLPPGARSFGRASKRASHRLYRVTEPIKSHQFRDGVEMLLELRSTGMQTVFPGSVHTSGELIDWDNQNEIPSITPEELIKALHSLANACLEARGKKPRIWSTDETQEVEPEYIPADLPPLTQRKKRARKYIAKMPAAESGKGGHVTTFNVAQDLRRGFGLPEEDSLEILREYNIRCIPPWTEHELRHKIDSAARCGRQKWYSKVLKEVTNQIPAEEDPKDDIWNPSELVIDSDYRVIPNSNNAVVYLTKHPAWRNSLAYDAFRDLVLWVQTPPPVPGFPPPELGPIQDEHTPYVQHWFGHQGIKLEKSHVQDALPSAAKIKKFNSLHDYLNSLTWDGIPRLSRWMATYLGAEDNKYTRSVGMWFMLSAVVRAFTPGEKMDYMLILEGLQGKKKSTVVSTLAKGWFLEGISDSLDKDAADALNGHWFVEVDELDALRKAGHNKVKSWVSKKKDTYRPAYGRCKVTRGRTCVFIGTTNDAEYLNDPTGARRFWPVKVLKVDLPGLKRDIDQLWAEAVSEHRKGTQCYPEDDRDPMLVAEQEKRFHVDPWEERIALWLGDRQTVTVNQVLTEALMLSFAQISKREEMRVATCLRRLGFERARVGTVRLWARNQE